jgi:aspartyl-tRNA(Asn)/glutamyl-tRNA(Gln) amidotransferase subunit C
MSAIDEATIRHVATLACLDLTDGEVTQYTQDMVKILQLVDQLNELDLDSIQEEQSYNFTQAIQTERIEDFRKDEGQHRFSRELLLENAPEEEDGFFRVPRILE